MKATYTLRISHRDPAFNGDVAVPGLGLDGKPFTFGDGSRAFDVARNVEDVNLGALLACPDVQVSNLQLHVEHSIAL